MDEGRGEGGVVERGIESEEGWKGKREERGVEWDRQGGGGERERKGGGIGGVSKSES